MGKVIVAYLMRIDRRKWIAEWLRERPVGFLIPWEWWYRQWRDQPPAYVRQAVKQVASKLKAEGIYWVSCEFGGLHRVGPDSVHAYIADQRDSGWHKSDINYEPPNVPNPTRAQPGTKEKVEELRRRVLWGEKLFLDCEFGGLDGPYFT
jgi:hypothetical protein